MARISALRPIESYAFGVYHQIVHNLAVYGIFEQTIHQGYDDAWTWSGHRAPALFSTALLYRLDGGVFGLARAQIIQVLLGVIPAALLGRQSLRGNPWGLMLGAALYLGTPAVLAMALQDYQDLVLAIPFLVALAWSLRARAWWWVIPGALVGLIPREETVLLVVAMAIIVVPWNQETGWRDRIRWRRWLLNIALCCGIAGAYAVGIESLFPATETDYRMPLANAVGGMGGGQNVIFLDGWPFIDRFYRDLLVPVGLLALLAPGPLIPAAGLVLFHMAIPNGHGIDRSWGGHCHHLAPAIPFLVVATIDGAGRLVRLAGRVPGGIWPRRLLVGAVAIGLAGLLGHSTRDFGQRQNVRLTLLPTDPTWVHPAWRLVTQIPEDAVPVVSKHLSILVSNRRTSYTIDGSLDSKAPMLGLGAGNFGIVDTRQGNAEARMMAMPNAVLLDEKSPFRLYSWTGGSPEPGWATQRGQRPDRVRPWLGPHNRQEDIPGVAPFESGRPPEGSGTPPSITLP